jgi:3-deoxy-D-manno-octulosonate 8-phosphate phosphatase (KDO 8-P phosphatase)
MMVSTKGDVSDQCRKKVQRVRLLALDVDGVLTDGKIVFDDDQRQTKSFDVKDGHGIKLLMRAGIDVALITSRESRVVLHRAHELGIELVYQKALKKTEAFEDLVSKTGVAAKEIAYVGDDLIDLPVLRMAGFSVAVGDAVDEVAESVDYITGRRGGDGAVREVCELILKLQGRWGEVTGRYFL